MTDPRDEAEIERLKLDIEALRAELDAFSYSVSHDLRAPLRAINGFGDILAGRIRAELDPDATELLDAVLRNGRKMDAMLTGLTSLVRVQRQELEPREVDMNELVRAALAELKADATPARIDVAPLPPAHGDARLLAQAWRALISNALKFSSRVAEPVITIGGREEAEACVYSIADNGSGFDMKYVSRLFNVFQRLHSPKDFEGLGVGLALADRVVRRHGGRMSAESEPGKLTTISFELPKAQAPAR